MAGRGAPVDVAAPVARLVGPDTGELHAGPDRPARVLAQGRGQLARRHRPGQGRRGREHDHLLHREADRCRVEPPSRDHPQPQRADPLPAPALRHQQPGRGGARPGGDPAGPCHRGVVGDDELRVDPVGARDAHVELQDQLVALDAAHRVQPHRDLGAGGEPGARVGRQQDEGDRRQREQLAVRGDHGTDHAERRHQGEPAQPRRRGEHQPHLGGLRPVGHRGAGTVERISVTTSAPVTRRTHSSGRRLIRCARAGTATAFTSSGVT